MLSLLSSDDRSLAGVAAAGIAASDVAAAGTAAAAAAAGVATSKGGVGPPAGTEAIGAGRWWGRIM